MAEPRSEGSFRRILTTMQNTVQGLTGPPQGSTALQQQLSTKAGWLRKQGGIVKSWHSRWFTLKGDQLYYYSSQDESKQPLGTIFLPGNKVTELPNNPNEPDKYMFEVVPGGDRNRMTATHETYPICAASEEERKSWVFAIKKIMYAPKGGAIFGQALQETMAYEHTISKRKIPELVEMCIDFLILNGLDVEGIFRLPGRSSVIRKLREEFDCGERPQLTLPDVDVHSVASLLKLFLRELPAPLIPVRLYETVMKIVTRDFHQNPDDSIVHLAQVLQGLPRHEYNLLQYLCFFLSQVGSKAEVNKMNPMNLATVFVQNNIIQPEDDDAVLLMGTANGRTQVAYVLITFCEQLFKVDYNEQGVSIPVDNLLNIDVPGRDLVSDNTGSTSREAQTASLLLDMDQSNGLPSPLAPALAGKETDFPSPTDDTSECGVSSGESESPAVVERSFQEGNSPSSSEKNLTNIQENEPSNVHGDESPPTEELKPSDQATIPSPETEAAAQEVQTSPSFSESTKVLRPTRPAPIPRSRSTRQRNIPQVYEGIVGDRRSLNIGQYEVTKPNRPLRAPPPPPPARPTEPPKTQSPASPETAQGQAEQRDKVPYGQGTDTGLEGLSQGELIAQIISLRQELHHKNLEVQTLQNNETQLKEQQREQVLDLSVRLEKEQSATAQSVSRIMELQKKLEKYALKHGLLV